MTRKRKESAAEKFVMLILKTLQKLFASIFGKKNDNESSATIQEPDPMLVPPPLPLKIVKHYKPRIILTNAEKLFFENLENVVNKKYSILCKVGL